MKNQTGIESWILRKARDRSYRREKGFIYPYDLGVKENCRQVFNWRESFNVIGDGLVWPVHEGSDEYALTREQIEQKREKRQRTIRYKVTQSYKGSFFTLRYGLSTCICIPCSDETRIQIEKDDFVFVTRWDKYWLYGERVINNETNKRNDRKSRRRPRGWFPRCCVYEAFRIEDLWSGKLQPDSEIVRSELFNIGPEEFEQMEQEQEAQNEENHSDDTLPTASSEPVRQRKIHENN